MAVAFWFLTHEKKVEETANKSLRERLAPLANVRVWRFGLYYFFVFGGFVALAQWLIPYFVNVYEMDIAQAGLMASIFILPSGVIRAFGGYLSDKAGARAVMYWVLGVSLVCCGLLVIPRMDIRAPGEGIMSPVDGTVTAVDEQHVVLGGRTFELRQRPENVIDLSNDSSLLILPTFQSWQVPAVELGQEVKRKELLARGVTHIYFQANMWIFVGLVFVLGIAMGIGKAAVYKHIPDYFPGQVGVVGGVVGVLGGLGGFVCPILFGYMLQGTGIWTTNWMFFFVLIAVCLLWMHLVVRKLMLARAPDLMRDIEQAGVSMSPALEENR